VVHAQTPASQMQRQLQAPESLGEGGPAFPTQSRRSPALLRCLPRVTVSKGVRITSTQPASTPNPRSRALITNAQPGNDLGQIACDLASARAAIHLPSASTTPGYRLSWTSPERRSPKKRRGHDCGVKNGDTSTPSRQLPSIDRFRRLCCCQRTGMNVVFVGAPLTPNSAQWRPKPNFP